MAGKAKMAAEVAGTVAAGGGPEDPVTDAIALGEVAGQGSAGAVKGGVGGMSGGGAPAGDGKKKKAPAKKKGGKGKRAISWAWSDNKKLLTAEFLACVVVLGLGTITASEESKDDVARAMIKGSALAGLFFLLALVSAGGKGPARAANAIGTLVTAAYVLTSSDVHNVAEWTASFFSKSSAAEDNVAKSPVDNDASDAGPAGNLVQI